MTFLYTLAGLSVLTLVCIAVWPTDWSEGKALSDEERRRDRPG